MDVAAEPWAPVPKIKEVDELITPSLQEQVLEGHPEVAFAGLTGEPMPHSKTTPAGPPGLARGALPTPVTRPEQLTQPLPMHPPAARWRRQLRRRTQRAALALALSAPCYAATLALLYFMIPEPLRFGIWHHGPAAATAVAAAGLLHALRPEHNNEPSLHQSNAD